MTANSFRRIGALAVLLGIAASSGCGEFVRQGQAPVMLVVQSIEAVAGGEGTGGANLLSDVLNTGGGVFNDSATVTLRVQAKNPAIGPSDINDVTVTRYRVTYRRSDGRNTPGVDVPFPIDSAVTVTIDAGSSANVGVELVRHNQKREPPLAVLGFDVTKLSVIADITFIGRDQAGNEVIGTGSIGITFGNFVAA